MHWALHPKYLALQELSGDTFEPAFLTGSTDDAWDKKIREGLQSGRYLLTDTNC